MENINPDFLPQQFSEDPQENLRIENEILHLTIKAELGGELMQHTELPPELENEFLKNVLAFEHAFADCQQIKVYDLLNRPAYKKALELADEEIPAALETITSILKEKDIVVEYMAAYDDRLKYTFITDELFEYEMNDVQMPGMITYFCYEEFHPDHKLEIEESARQFITAWFEHNLGDYSEILGDSFILPDLTTLSREEVIAKIKITLDAYPVIKDHDYDLFDIEFEFLEKSGVGVGHVEGSVKYTAILESGESVEISGTFKLYMCMEYSCWRIIYFVFPGFNWA